MVTHVVARRAVLFGLVVGSIFTSACAGTDSGSAGRDSQAEDIVAGKTASKYPEAVLVDMQRSGAQALCSGALIAPRVVLTAGHCVHGWSAWRVEAPFAKDQSAAVTAGATYDWNVDSEVVDPSAHDVGLLFLATPISLASYPTLAKAHVPFGAKVENIGRIKNGEPSFTKLFVGREVTVADGARYGFPLSYASSDVIESGDSGGPVVKPATHEIVAVNSGAGNGLQVLARVDLVERWITEQIAAHGGEGPTGAPAEDAGCGDLTYRGRCAGEVVEWCDKNVQKRADCGARGDTCAYDKSNKIYDCF